jgi:hypothetical protein
MCGLRAGRLFVSDVFNANGALFISQPGAAPQGFVWPSLSAESAIHSKLIETRALIRAFSADLRSRPKSWGDAPGYHERAPLALNAYSKREGRLRVHDGSFAGDAWTDFAPA